jgi:hypothetical protein
LAASAKKAALKFRNHCQTRYTFAFALLSRGKNPLWVTGTGAAETGGKSQKFMDEGFRERGKTLEIHR